MTNPRYITVDGVAKPLTTNDMPAGCCCDTVADCTCDGDTTLPANLYFDLPTLPDWGTFHLERTAGQCAYSGHSHGTYSSDCALTFNGTTHKWQLHTDIGLIEWEMDSCDGATLISPDGTYTWISQAYGTTEGDVTLRTTP